MNTPWSSRPFWSIARRVDVTGFPQEDLLSVYRDWGVIRKSDRDDNFNRPGEDLASYKLVEPGDLVLNKMKTWQGSLGVSAYRGIVSPAYYVCRISPVMHGRFLHHLLRSRRYIAYYESNSKGIRTNQWDLPYEHLRQLLISAPALDEQRRIADFLDDRVARIDQIIAARRQQIALIDETDRARIDEYFQAPYTDPLTRLGRFARVQTGLTVDSGRALGPQAVTRPYLRVANVQSGHLDLSEVTTVTVPFETAERCTLRVGDVLMTEGGDIDKLGRGTVWRGEIDGCLHQNHVFAVRVEPAGLSPEFLAYYTRTSAAREHFETTGSKTTNLASTSSAKVLALPIPTWPLRRQLDAVAGYAFRAAEVARGRSRFFQQIDLLTEYKSSLITAAVTGELDVTTASRRIPGE